MSPDPMDAFSALVASLGEHLVDLIGRENIRSLEVVGSPLDETAEVFITLRDDSWQRTSAAIDKVVEVRRLFLDDLSFDYTFGDSYRQHHEVPAPRTPIYALPRSA